MLTTEQINDLHRTYWSEHWPIRKIERQLNIGWRTIRKYLDAPAQNPAHRERPSKLDPFKAAISEWIEKDPTVSAAVIEQKLRSVGYDGGHSILREHVRNIRPKAAPRRAFVRMEPIAGERFEVDWGHFGALDYSGDSRKLYAFALVDAHSRMLYVEFTHSQSFQTFARCHIHAFTALGGVAREIAYDTCRWTSRLRTSFIRSSPRATVRSGPPSSPPTRPSPTGATSSSIRPSRQLSQTGWSRTPKSSCSAAKAFAKRAGTQLRRKNNFFRLRSCAALCDNPAEESSE